MSMMLFVIVHARVVDVRVDVCGVVVTTCYDAAAVVFVVDFVDFVICGIVGCAIITGIADDVTADVVGVVAVTVAIVCVVVATNDIVAGIGGTVVALDNDVDFDVIDDECIVADFIDVVVIIVIENAVVFVVVITLVAVGIVDSVVVI